MDASESPEAFAVFAGENVAGLFGVYFAIRWKASLCVPAGVLVDGEGNPYDSVRLASELGIASPVLFEGLSRMRTARLLVEVPVGELVLPVKVQAIPAKFEEWWGKYPASRRVNRPLCLNTWRLRSLEAIADEVLAGLENHLASEQWAKDGGQFVPNTTTWLNQSRWAQKLKPIVATYGEPPQKWRGEKDYDPETIVQVPDDIFTDPK